MTPSLLPILLEGKLRRSLPPYIEAFFFRSIHLFLSPSLCRVRGIASFYDVWGVDHLPVVVYRS